MRSFKVGRVWILAWVVAAGACTQGPGSSASAQTADQDCVPIETREANAERQSPAFAGQTRTCGVDSEVAFEVTVVASGLERPWAVEPLPDGSFLVTERPGRLRLVSPEGAVGPPISGVPEVDARGQGGLLDVALSPSFPTDRMVYWSYAEPRQGGNGTSVARGRLSDDGRSLEGVEVVLRSVPTYAGDKHFGSRLAFGPDGKLYVTLGERSDRETRAQAQHMDSDLGKILRINPDGSIPEDNPFVANRDARPEIWSVGHRNVQGATFDPDGRLWTVEHGPRGGDELNRIEAGVNYGWPVQSYGQEYSGRGIRGSSTTREGIRQPVYYWDPVIAPSGAQWYSGDMFPAWRGSLFIGALRQERLVRLEVRTDAAGERAVAEEHFLVDRGERVRDVRQGPDGALYVVTDSSDGVLLRISAP